MIHTMKAIKWINKFSGETGYVESLADDHFVNTWEIEYAAKFRTVKEADKALDALYDFGEDVNNDFEVVDIPKAEKPKATVKKTTTKTAAKKTEKAAPAKTAAKKTEKAAPAKTVAKKTAAADEKAGTAKAAKTTEKKVTTKKTIAKK